jgi:hypothetical protein
MTQRHHADPQTLRPGTEPVAVNPGLQRRVSEGGPVHDAQNAGATTLQALQRAAGEAAHGLASPVRRTLEAGLQRDFSGVRVHSGPASAHAAERIGARAYTLGRDIHLGAEVQSLSGNERHRLLTHEAVHTVQQGGGSVAPHPGLVVSRPNDAAEMQAERIADALSAPPPAASASLALRDRLRAAPHVVGPRLQRDLKDTFKVSQGDFKVDLKTESHKGAKNGMSGTIKFNANQKAPDSTSIRLLQVAKMVDLPTAKDYVWTGGEANRHKTMTKAEPGVDPGWFVDQLYKGLKPRTKKTDAAISPYYIDYGNSGPANNRDGSKKGKTVSEASLWDYPGWGGKARFSFETIAKASDTGHVYGTVMWGFTISDPAKGTVDKEHAAGRDVTLLSSDRAIANYDAFFRNPGAAKAP